MPEIQINNETLNYNNIIYVDSENGSNSMGDGSESNPYLTIQVAIDRSSDGDAIYIKGHHEFQATGHGNTGSDDHIYLPSHNLDFIGDGLISKIENTADTNLDSDNNVIRNIFSVPESGDYVYNYYNLFLTCSNIDSNTYPELFQTYSGRGTQSNCNVNFYNCVLEGYDGIRDLNIINIYNCSINMERTFVDDTTVNNINNTAGKSNYNFSNSNNCLWSSTFDNDWNITSSGWQNTGTGVNPDGTQANIGVYGGPYAWGKWIELYHLFNDNGYIKTYNNGWKTICQKGNETEADFLDNGIENIDTTTLSDLKSSNPQLLTWTDDLENTRQTKLSAIPNDQLIIPNSDIDLSDVSNIDDITLNADLSGNGDMKIVASKDSGSTWQAVYSQFTLIDFENNDLSDWTIHNNNFEIKSDYVYEGSYSVGIEDNSTGVDIASYELNNGIQPSFFEFYYLETSSSTGTGLELIDSNGEYLCAFNTDNPQWNIKSSSGWEEIYSNSDYETWHKVRFEFDWNNGTFNYTIKNLNSNYSETGTKNLNTTNNFKKIFIKNVNTGTFDSGDSHMWFDNIKFDYKSSEINNINLNKTDISTNGTTPTEFNNITSTTWSDYIGDSNTLRFAYYLDIDSEEDIAETNLLEMQVDLQGDWANAIHMTDYDYEYTDNNTITVDLLTDGSYKINYQK